MTRGLELTGSLLLTNRGRPPGWAAQSTLPGESLCNSGSATRPPHVAREMMTDMEEVELVVAHSEPRPCTSATYS